MTEPRTKVSTIPDWMSAVIVPLVLALAAAATWWPVGDLSSPVPAGTDVDYAFEPPAITPQLVTACGIVATVVDVAVLIAGGVAVRAGRLRGAPQAPL